MTKIERTMRFSIKVEYARKGYEYGYSHTAVADGEQGLRVLVRRYRLRDFVLQIDGNNTLWFTTNALTSSMSALCVLSITGERNDLDALVDIVSDNLSSSENNLNADALVVTESY